MERVVSTRREGDVAIVTIDNPPVNALSHAVRSGLIEALDAAERDHTVRAVVLACAGKTFVAGADIKEFGEPPKLPWLSDVNNALDGMTKPVVAAIHGTALGGGLELALSCHARVAVESAKLGLPEVKLGLLPGAGGTQRLPRAVGANTALRMIVSGEPVSASQALKDGLVDVIASAELVGSAATHARRLASEAKLRRLRDDDNRLVADRADTTRFDQAASELTKRARGFHAPAACIEAVRGALTLPFEEGVKRERALFEELMNGDQSKAQRHLFFAEREAAKIAGVGKDVLPRPISRVAVIGAGTMGKGIAIALADAGIRVKLIEADQDALRFSLAAIEASYRDAATRKKLDDVEAGRRIGLIQGGLGVEAASGADLVIEAVFEDMDLKRRLFAELDGVTGPRTILATNTSYLDVDEIASATRRPSSVVGMHFFSPANVMRLVEIVRGKETSPDVLVTIVSLARRLGKTPVVVGNCHGFVGNRMLRQRNMAAETLMLEGALAQDIDAAMVAFGFPMGPLAATDLAGLDVGRSMRKALGLRAEIADELCEAGRLGLKAGRGFYRYEAGSRVPIADPEVEAIIVEASRRLGLTRRPVGQEEIVERLIRPIIDEGAQILKEGIAARSGDIDVIWVNGYGWPAWRGGPMYYAETTGIKEGG